MKILLYFLLVYSWTFSKEPSAFKAGDLDSLAPYGLTNTEKYIYSNKKDIKRISSKLKKLKSKIQESTNILLNSDADLNNKFLQIKKETNLKQDVILQKFDSIKSNVAENSENIQVLKAGLVELTDLLGKVYKKYDKLASVEARLSSLEKKINLKKAKPKQKLGYYVFENAQKLFKNKKYNQAKIVFEKLVRLNYRKAYSSFYLGEINFYQKRYRYALAMYKQSISIYQKSSYRPKLLLHSGISSIKLKNKKQAKAFLSIVVNEFSKSKEAKEAKKILKKL